MADEPIVLPKWAANALIIAAAICLLESLWLAFHDKVASGTLTAGLFVVCVLFVYMPKMQSFKAWGIEATWPTVKAQEEKVRRASAEVENLRKELKAQSEAPDVPKEKLAVTIDKVDRALTQLSTANADLSATLTTIAPPRATRGSN